jgi:HK97 family phage major capsid protein
MAKEHERRNPVKLPSPVRAFIDVKPVAKRKHQMNAAQLRDLFSGGVVEMRDLLTTGSAGNLVPTVYEKWTEAVKWTSPLNRLVTRFDRVGKPQFVKTATIDDTANNMTQVAESGSTSTLEADPTIVVNINGSASLISKIRFSVQLMSDAFAFQQWLLGAAAARVSRAVNTALTTGLDGAGAQLQNNVTDGLLGSARVAGTAATAGQIGYAADIVNQLVAAVDPAYRANGVFMVSQAGHDWLAAQLDSTSRPHYSFDADGDLLVMGKKCLINSAMQFATGKPAILFGDFSRSFAWLDGGSSIRIIREAVGLAENLLAEALIVTRIGSGSLLQNSVQQILAK